MLKIRDFEMSSLHSRMIRERKTINVMIGIYCKGNHRSSSEMCIDCKELLGYAIDRLDKCSFQENKPTCASCPIHCYKPAMREKIRNVMRYSGPRMLYRHPILALLHLIDRRKKPISS